MTDTKGTPSNLSDDIHLVYFYDANGNIGQLVKAVESTLPIILARYEYYPFGGILVSTGTYAEINPFKFSTKYRDTETNLYYYGYRYLIPRLGRWVNRDPMFVQSPLWEDAPLEAGLQSMFTPRDVEGGNLYTGLANSPTGAVDPLGLKLHLHPSGESRSGPCGSYSYVWSVSFGADGAPCDGYLIQEVHVQAQVVPCKESKKRNRAGRIERESQLISVIPDDIVYWEAIRVKRGDKTTIRDTASFPGFPETFGHNSQRAVMRLFCDSPEIGDLGKTWPVGPVASMPRAKDWKGEPLPPWTSGSFPHTTDRPSWWKKYHKASGEVSRVVTTGWDCCCGGTRGRTSASQW